jgi:hypothetical protein
MGEHYRKKYENYYLDEMEFGSLLLPAAGAK